MLKNAFLYFKIKKT